MKKILLLFTAMLALSALQAQWVNDPVNNTFIANTSADAGEIYLATSPLSSDTYVQWSQFNTNGWAPHLQRLNFDGVPQWDANGITIPHQFASYSEGFAIAATTDGSVVSCFAVYDGFTYAVKINIDGSFAWGEEGIQLFGGQGFSRAEVIADNNGGVWALGSDFSNLYLQHVDADGSLGPCNTIADNSGKACAYGQLTLSHNNNVFVTYEKLGSGYGLYKEKELFVAGYAPDGTQISPETQLMTGLTFQVTYIHSVVADGLGGGYAYLWHSGINNTFNTYVFHFNENGASTIEDTYGIAVHSPDEAYYYIDADATVDPVTHDLLIAYQQTDAAYQAQCQLFVNRITATGDRVWEEGYLILDNGDIPCGGLRINTYEDGEGFSVIYHKGLSQFGFESTVEAQGFDKKGVQQWSTQLCSNAYKKTGDENSTGFHRGQNIVAWVNSDTGGLYGQNIAHNGAMGYDPLAVPENSDEEIINIIKVYNINGQELRHAKLENLSRGVYLIQGTTHSGRLVTRKHVVNF